MQSGNVQIHGIYTLFIDGKPTSVEVVRAVIISSNAVNVVDAKGVQTAAIDLTEPDGTISAAKLYLPSHTKQFPTEIGFIVRPVAPDGEVYRELPEPCRGSALTALAVNR